MLGEFLIIFAAFLCATYYKLFEKLKEYPFYTNLTWAWVVAVVVIYLVYGNYNLNNIIELPMIGWLYILLLVLVITIGGYGFLIISTKKIGALKTGTVDFMEPIFGVILAMLIFGESMSLIQLVGWTLIIFTLINIKRIK